MESWQSVPIITKLSYGYIILWNDDPREDTLLSTKEGHETENTDVQTKPQSSSYPAI